MKDDERQVPLSARLLAIGTFLVVSGLGVLALMTQHAPERATRFGSARELHGAEAGSFGVSIFLAGLLPLMLLMRSRTAAARFGSLVGIALLVSLFLAVR